jgi:hypothetical protein
MEEVAKDAHLGSPSGEQAMSTLWWCEVYSHIEEKWYSLEPRTGKLRNGQKMLTSIRDFVKKEYGSVGKVYTCEIVYVLAFESGKPLFTGFMDMFSEMQRLQICQRRHETICHQIYNKDNQTKATSRRRRVLGLVGSNDDALSKDR